MPVVNIENSVTDQSLWEGAKRGRKGKIYHCFFTVCFLTFCLLTETLAEVRS